MSVQQTASNQILKSTEYLCSYAQHVPHEKIDWRAGGATKSVREILSHTVDVNGFFTKLISGGDAGSASNGTLQNVGMEQMIASVRSSGQRLADTILTLSDAELSGSRSTPDGNPWEVTKAISTAGMHIAYHWGQISYLQTLWGDAEDHF